MTKEISKATATKKSGNWYRWCTLFTHGDVEEKFLDGLQHKAKTTLVSSFVESAHRNQFGTKKKSKILHKTVKASISYISESFQKDLSSDLNLGKTGQRYLILQRQLRGYKSMVPPIRTIDKSHPILCCIYIRKSITI